MNPRILELAKECGAKDGVDNEADAAFLEKFYKRANQDGQKQMWEAARRLLNNSRYGSDQ